MTAATSNPTTPWDRLFAKPRHRLRCPDENVVRFLAPLSPDDGDALDAGCGSGRHTRLLTSYGWRTYACDSSEQACILTKQLSPDASVVTTDLTNLPYADGAFNVVVACAALYYGTRDETTAKFHEVHRVLRKGGRAFVSMRSTRDSRFYYMRGGRLKRPADERGMVCDFLTHEEIGALAAPFAFRDLKLTETFKYSDNWRDSHWLLTLAR